MQQLQKQLQQLTNENQSIDREITQLQQNINTNTIIKTESNTPFDQQALRNEYLHQSFTPPSTNYIGLLVELFLFSNNIDLFQKSLCVLLSPFRNVHVCPSYNDSTVHSQIGHDQ